MKKTKNFNISVPELGDKPDITQVSNAIQDLEDALAGTLEVMTASIQGSALTLTSGARTTKRTKYYEGMAIKFVAPIQINPNSVTTAKVDDLASQTLEIPYLVNAGDSVDIVYKGNKFVGTISAVQRSNAINSSSDTTVATSLAVKTAYDKAVDGVNKANAAQNSANAAQNTADSKVSKSGDTMTGTLTIGNIKLNQTITSDSFSWGSNAQVMRIESNRLVLGNTNLRDLSLQVSSDSGAKVLIGTTPRIIYHTGNFDPSQKTDKGGYSGTAQNLRDLIATSQTTADGKVSKSGDIMTGKLAVDSKMNVSPAISLSIGDQDTGFDYVSDGVVDKKANNVGISRISIEGENYEVGKLKVGGQDVYSPSNKPSPSAIGALSNSNGTMSGLLTINHSGNASIIANSPTGTANYYIGRINGENHFYLGKGSSTSDDTSFYNYKYNVEVRLANGYVKTTAPINTGTNVATGLVLYRNNTKDTNNNIQFSYTNGNYYFGVVNGKLKFGTSQDLTSGYDIYHSGNKPMIGKRDVLWQGDLQTGNFTLSSSFENYDFLVFQVCADNYGSLGYTLIFKDELTMQKGQSTPFNIGKGQLFWEARLGSDGRTFTTTAENCRMRKVIGGRI